MLNPVLIYIYLYPDPGVDIGGMSLFKLLLLFMYLVRSSQKNEYQQTKSA